MRITQAFEFCSAHRLPNVPKDHKCYRMHGHQYRLEVTLEGAVNETTGFVLDFGIVEGVIGQFITQLDHNVLNDVEGLENPTAENIAIWVWRRVHIALPNVKTVRVYETPDCWAEYSRPAEGRE